MEENKKNILIGSSLIVFFFICLGGIAASAYLPGFSGELGRMLGITYEVKVNGLESLFKPLINNQ